MMNIITYTLHNTDSLTIPPSLTIQILSISDAQLVCIVSSLRDTLEQLSHSSVFVFVLFCSVFSFLFIKKKKNKAGFKSAAGVKEGNQAHEHVSDKKREKEKNAGSFLSKMQ